MKWIKLYFRLLNRYLQYFYRAKTRYDVHAPFAFAFTEQVLEDDRQYYAFRDIELLRNGLLKDKTQIAVQDYGAGSRVDQRRHREVRSIARYSAVSPSSGQLLFRLVQFLKPQTLLELGTSLGISGAYQAAAASAARMITLEGCPETAALARQHFQNLGLTSVEARIGRFEEELPAALSQLGQVDYLYIDGDHRRGATTAYLKACLPYLHPHAVVVLADIHWSNEMEAAWAELREQDGVRLSIDLFHFGLLFFRPEQKTPQQLTLIPARFKPWRMGFFG